MGHDDGEAGGKALPLFLLSNGAIPNFKYVTSLQILKFEIRIDLSLDRTSGSVTIGKK